MSHKKIAAEPFMVRQGDVLIMSAKGDPRTPEHKEEPRDRGSVVLAHGPVTGHRHRFDDLGVNLFRAEGLEDRVLTVAEPTQLRHEEHDAIDVPPGTYIVRIQKEYSETAQSRAVVD